MTSSANCCRSGMGQLVQVAVACSQTPGGKSSGWTAVSSLTPSRNSRVSPASIRCAHCCNAKVRINAGSVIEATGGREFAIRKITSHRPHSRAGMVNSAESQASGRLRYPRARNRTPQATRTPYSQSTHRAPSSSSRMTRTHDQQAAPSTIPKTAPTTARIDMALLQNSRGTGQLGRLVGGSSSFAWSPS